MRWVRNWILREGPGIPKDAPKKTGLALLAQIVGREWWELIKLNLLFILLSLPLVTLPAAYASMVRITARMVEDRNVYLLREFWEGFLALFGPATLFALLGSAPLALGGYSVFIYSQLVGDNLAFALLLAPCLAGTVFALLALTYLIIILATTHERGMSAVRLALLAALARPLPMLAALMFVAALWLAHILLYPMSVFMPAVLNFSFGALATTFAGLSATKFVLALRGRREADEAMVMSSAGRGALD